MAPAVLVIAGTDSSCGAGVAADLAALGAHGVGARLAVTAVTAQGPDGVRGVWPMPGAGLLAQLEAAGSVDAVKVGMLGSAEAVQAVEGWLAARPELPVVVDPVLGASGGGDLLDPGALDALRQLLRRATLVTPNLPELETLGGEAWLADQPGAVLVKGGHGPGQTLVDRLVGAGTDREWRHQRLPGAHRGTGCRLASAVAAGLARGRPCPEAVDAAIRWLQQALRATRGPQRNPPVE